TEAMLKKTSSASLDRSAVFQPQNKRVMRAGAPVGTFFGSSYSAIVLQPKPVVPGQRLFRRLGLLPASLWAKPQPQGRSRHGPVAFSQSNNGVGIVLRFGLGALRSGDGGDDAAGVRGTARLSRVQSTSS